MRLYQNRKNKAGGVMGRHHREQKIGKVTKNVQTSLRAGSKKHHIKIVLVL